MGKRTVTSVNVIDVEKRRLPSKHYVYVIQVSWSDGIEAKIFRRYSVFYDFQCRLLDDFPDEAGVHDPATRIIPFLPGKKYLGRSHIRKVALERLQAIEEYCQALIKLPPEISQSKIVTEFFSLLPEDLNPPSQEKEKWKADKISRPKTPERYIAIADYRAEKQGEVDLVEGMLVSEVIEKSDSGWWFVTTNDAQGWAPSTYLQREDGTSDPPVFTAKPGEEERYIVTQDFTSSGHDELSVSKGEKVDVVEKYLQGWWLVRYGGEEGWVPSTYLKPYDIGNNRQSLAMVSDKVEIIGHLSEISPFFNHQSIEPTLKSPSKKPPPHVNSLTRGFSPPVSPPTPQYVTVAEFCDKVGDGISFHAGETVKVIEKTSTGWWYVEIASEEGWAPASYIAATGKSIRDSLQTNDSGSCFSSDEDANYEKINDSDSAQHAVAKTISGLASKRESSNETMTNKFSRESRNGNPAMLSNEEREQHHDPASKKIAAPIVTKASTALRKLSNPKNYSDSNVSSSDRSEAPKISLKPVVDNKKDDSFNKTDLLKQKIDKAPIKPFPQTSSGPKPPTKPTSASSKRSENINETFKDALSKSIAMRPKSEDLLSRDSQGQTYKHDDKTWEPPKKCEPPKIASKPQVPKKTVIKSASTKLEENSPFDKVVANNGVAQSNGKCLKPISNNGGAQYNRKSSTPTSNQNGSRSKSAENIINRLDDDLFKVIGDFDGQNDGELTLREGSVVRVQQRDSSGWWFVADDHSEGWAPASYLEPAPKRDSTNRSAKPGLPSKPPKPQIMQKPIK